MDFFTETGLLSAGMIAIESAFVAFMCGKAYMKSKRLIAGGWF